MKNRERERERERDRERERGWRENRKKFQSVIVEYHDKESFLYCNEQVSIRIQAMLVKSIV